MLLLEMFLWSARNQGLRCGWCWDSRVTGIVGTIHSSWPGTRVIVLGILPRGTHYWDGGSAVRDWPNVLTPAIDALNNALQVRTTRPCPHRGSAEHTH